MNSKTLNLLGQSNALRPDDRAILRPTNLPEKVGRASRVLTNENPDNFSSKQNRNRGTKLAAAIVGSLLSIVTVADLDKSTKYTAEVPEQGIYGEGGQVTDIAKDLREQEASVSNLVGIDTVIKPGVEPGDLVIMTDKTGYIASAAEGLGDAIGTNLSLDGYKIEKK